MVSSSCAGAATHTQPCPAQSHSVISMPSDWQLCPAPCSVFLAHLFSSQYSSFSCIFKLSLAAKFLLLLMLQCKARKGQPQLSAGQGLPPLLCLAFVAWGGFVSSMDTLPEKTTPQLQQHLLSRIRQSPELLGAILSLSLMDK